MKIKDIIKYIDKSDEYKDDIDVSEFGFVHFEIYGIKWQEESKLTSYYFEDWHCTDSRVGAKIYFLKDKAVAIGYQSGRKSSEKIEWFSKELYNKVKTYLESLPKEPGIELEIALFDEKEKLDNHYQILYHSQLFPHHYDKCWLGNEKSSEKVEIIELHKGNKFNKNGIYEPSLVKIRTYKNKEFWIGLPKLHFKYNLKKIKRIYPDNLI